MHYYTCETIYLPKQVLEVPYAYTAISKNIYNSALYLIRQIISAYNQVKNTDIDGKIITSYVIKSDLHNNVIQSLELANLAVDLLNFKQNKKKSNNDIKQSQYQWYEPEVNSHTYYQFLNSNLLNNMLKIKDKLTDYQDYTQISIQVANSAVESAIQDYKNYLASLKSYHNNKELFLGKPQPPKYKSKSSRLGYSLDKNRLTKDGYLTRVITKDNILKFSSIKDKTNINKLYTCAEKKELINQEDIDIYNSFSFISYINKVTNDIQNRDNESLSFYNATLKVSNKIISKITFVGFKFIPNDKYLINGKPKVIVEAVLKHTIDLPEENLLAKILKINAKFLELSSDKKIEFIKHNFPQHDLTHNVAALDLGVVNHAGMTFNTGAKGLVISGKKYQNYVVNKEFELDKIKSSLIPKAVKDIQSHQAKAKDEYNLKKTVILKQIEQKSKNRLSEDEIKVQLDKELLYPVLNKQDKTLLNQTKINIYSNQEYINKLDKLNNYKQNYLHKLSNEIVEICVYNKVNYLIIGKNNLWKQNSNLGKINNRNSHAIAHAKLIEYIQYKALLFGIVVQTPEESYTSKTSFVNNSILKQYSKIGSTKSNKNDNIKNGVKVNKIKKTIVEYTNQIPSTESIPESKVINKRLLKSTFGGVRQSRGKYVNSVNETNLKPMVIHADINGSYNIMRKVFTQMKYNSLKHNLNYKIVAVQSNKRHVQLIC